MSVTFQFKSQVIRRFVSYRVDGQKISAKISVIIRVVIICSGWFIIGTLQLAIHVVLESKRGTGTRQTEGIHTFKL